ncbi:MAG: LytTR family transcriptional regulator DNA-binding domain-containing protein, partial [Chitinophagaceae bacterium]
YLTLAEIEDKLPSSFLRVSKSFIINTDKISHLEGNEIYLVNIKEGFLISPSYKDSFSVYMKDHLIKTKRL